MKVTRAAKALGIDERTLKLWIERPELAVHFSPLARREGAGRDMNDDDIITANTIRTLRAGTGNSNVDWQHIAAELERGYRDRSLPPEAASVDSGITVYAQHERMVTVITERDNALARLLELDAALKDERQNRLADVERLLREQAAIRDEQATIREKLARAEVELDLWRAGRIKPE